ncbi:C3a anaphylatoxin chemotactic receptor-like [Python bivittatus]|uniref:C3a anaphylatoxin chemotactic receptor-like n=1 Tax=Python bivittatus TaxID=176946 RepID=A0A9F2R4A5_PYTBI|nr:C3a anaphylatoxin chemotactic receptor-like [Python bivittatus]
MKVNLTAPGLSNASLPSSLENSSDINRLRVMLQIFFYGVIFLLGSLGNGAVIWITVRQISRTISCVWFFNLALADLFFSMSRIAPLINAAVYEGWASGTFACKANGFIKYLNMFCSVFLLAAISMDRAACIAYPMWSRKHRNTRLAWLGAIGAWFMAVVTSVPFYIYRNVDTRNNQTKCLVMLQEDGPVIKVTIYTLRLICGFLAPFTIIVICYSIIIMVLRRRQTSLRSKAFKVILALVVTFFFCWAPYHIIYLLRLAGMSGTDLSLIHLFAAFLAYLNSCANPVLYFFMGMDFHKKLTFYNITRALKKILLEDEFVIRKSSGNNTELSSIHEQAKSSEVYQMHCGNSKP